MDSPQQRFEVLGSSHGFNVLLKRNCSSSPAGLGLVFASLAVVTLSIGAGFAAIGAWLVLPFAGLEAVMLAGAFLMVARQAAGSGGGPGRERNMKPDAVIDPQHGPARRTG